MRRTGTGARLRRTRRRPTPTSSALTPIGFLPLIETNLDDYAGTIGVRGDVAGWKADFSAGRGHNSFDYQVHDTLNTSFGPQSQSDFDAGGLRYGQTIFNLDLSREFEAGFAKPLAVAVGAEHRREDFKIRPGDLQSWAIGPFFRAAFTTTAANCATQQGVFNATTGVCSFPGRQAPVGRAGLPGHSGQQRDGREPPQLGRVRRARHRSASTA